MDKVNEFERDVESNIKGKNRFAEDANEHYRYPSDADFVNDKKTILQYFRHHRTNQRPRLSVLKKYYDGQNTEIFKKERRKEKEMADHRAAHNFAGYISNFIQGYVSGVPIKTEYVRHPDDIDGEDENVLEKWEIAKKESEEVNDVLQKMNRRNEADEHNTELVLDQSIYGRAYELIYRENKKIWFVKLNPQETFVVYSTGVRKNPVGAVRYHESFDDPELWDIWAYSEREVVHYRTTKENHNDLEEIERMDANFNGVQVNEYENNSSRTGDFESVLTLIDLYDSAQSDLANYSQDLNDAMLKITGYLKLDPKETKTMKRNNVIFLKPSITPKGDLGNVEADYIYKKYDVQGMEAYKTRIQNDIFLTSNVPNLLDENFGGTQSGEALKMKMFGLAQKRAIKERKFKKALRNRYRLIKESMRIAQETEFDVEDLVITFTENMPRAVSQEIEWFSKLGGELSQDTMLGLLSFVENPREEKQKIEAERKASERENSMDFERFVEEEEEIGNEVIDDAEDDRAE